MADCFSLPNAAELVKTLRTHAEYCEMPFSWMNEAYEQAADTIEALLAENEKLKEKCDKCGESAHSVIKELIEQNAKLKEERDHWEEIARERGEHYRQMRRERDAAVADLSKYQHCTSCKRLSDKNICDVAEECSCFFGAESLWEWRGVTDTHVGSKKEEEND